MTYSVRTALGKLKGLNRSVSELKSLIKETLAAEVVNCIYDDNGCVIEGVVEKRTLDRHLPLWEQELEQKTKARKAILDRKAELWPTEDYTDNLYILKMAQTINTLERRRDEQGITITQRTKDAMLDNIDDYVCTETAEKRFKQRIKAW